VSILRLFPIILVLPGFAFTAEPPYPLWDGKETVEQYAKRANLPATKTLELGHGAKLELVLIPAGEFQMGSKDGESDEVPIHKVKLTRPFYFGMSLIGSK